MPVRCGRVPESLRWFNQLILLCWCRGWCHLLGSAVMMSCYIRAEPAVLWHSTLWCERLLWGLIACLCCVDWAWLCHCVHHHHHHHGKREVVWVGRVDMNTLHFRLGIFPLSLCFPGKSNIFQLGALRQAVVYFHEIFLSVWTRQVTSIWCCYFFWWSGNIFHVQLKASDQHFIYLMTIQNDHCVFSYSLFSVRAAF